MNRFSIQQTPLAGLNIVKRNQLSDSRGFLSRLFCLKKLESAGWHGSIAQINHTSTIRKGTIRGMHFQLPPHSEIKLVNCLMGEIWDVAVDIRAQSPTFLKWFGVHLSAGNCMALMIPKGFAHGFQTLTDNVEMLYCHSTSYHPESEQGLNPKDPILAIKWPDYITEMSDRDKLHPFINDDFQGVQP